MANQQICHFFHTPRGCRNGNRCHYLHTSMTESLVKDDLPADTPPLCIYYQYGNCRFGNECKFSHSEKNMVDNVKGMKEDSGEKEVMYECGICLEKIETYGLLIGCDHIFCIACISSWRNEAKPGISRSEIAAKRGCPTCRKHSDFVIPSNSFVTGREKQKLVEERLSQRKVTRCRDWDNNRSCR